MKLFVQDAELNGLTHGRRYMSLSKENQKSVKNAIANFGWGSEIMEDEIG